MSIFDKLVNITHKGLKIIIIGGGKIGSTLADKLTLEGNDVTVIDNDPDVVEELSATLDIRGIHGNGSSYTTLMDAGIESADLLIAVTASDELNLLCCALAKKVGNCASIARVRNPDYSEELSYLRDRLDISLIINPELEVAREITRLLHFPSAISVNSFARGSVDIIKFKIPAENILDNLTISEFQHRYKFNLLICVVERNGVLTIPDGDFCLRSGDIISFISTPKVAYSFFKKIHLESRKVNSAIIVGGGKTSYYLAKSLMQSGISVKIIEQDEARCTELSSLLPESLIIVNGNGTEESLLMQENLSQTGALIPLTGIDEENILLTLYALRIAPNIKAVTKVNRTNFSSVINELDLGSVVYPRHLVAEIIVKYVRAKKNSLGSNIETLYYMYDERVEALEFNISSNSDFLNIPLKNLKLKKRLLIASITRNGRAIIPGGDDVLKLGDSVIIVTTNKGYSELNDIFEG